MHIIFTRVVGRNAQMQRAKPRCSAVLYYNVHYIPVPMPMLYEPNDDLPIAH